MSPEEVADRYFEAVRNRDLDGLITLFADNAIFTIPNGMRVEGADAIRAFQTDIFARGGPLPTPGLRVAGPREIVVEIKAQLPDGSVRSTANFFYLNEAGRIQTLNVYAQSS